MLAASHSFRVFVVPSFNGDHMLAAQSSKRLVIAGVTLLGVSAMTCSTIARSISAGEDAFAPARPWEASPKGCMISVAYREHFPAAIPRRKLWSRRLHETPITCAR